MALNSHDDVRLGGLSAHSCVHCEQIIITRLNSRFFITRKSKSHTSAEFSLEEVVQATRENCVFFKARFERLVGMPQSQWFQLDWPLELKFSIEEEGFSEIGCYWGEDDNGEILYTLEFEGVSDPRDEPFRPLNKFPASQNTRRDIRLWATECWTTHDKCRTERGLRAANGTMPARLVRISATQGDNVTICDAVPAMQANETKAQYSYAALSYCWGADEPSFTLNTKSIDEARAGFCVQRLPKTIRDAIITARAMDIEYLWVDSLCIVQDDNQDKKRELPKMADIYSRAAVVISAAVSKSCTAGFLQPRDISKLLKCVYKFPYFPAKDGLQRGFTLLSDGPPTDLHKTEHIDKRCWTLQEHIQAVSILRFGSRQVRWSCLEGQFTDGGTYSPIDDGDNELEFNPTKFNGLYYQHHKDLWKDLGSYRIFDHICDFWQGLVEHYTSRSISNEKDVLPAFGAVAQTWARITNGQLGNYYAGLWGKDLHRQLLWFMREPISHPTTRSAPSWSWASCPGKTKERTRLWLHEQKIRIVDCRVVPEDESWVYGGVVSGQLTIIGQLSPLHKLRLFFGETAMTSSNTEHKDGDGVYMDIKNEAESHPLWCLELVRARGNEEHRATALGLVLSRNEDGTFQRVGFYRYGVDESIKLIESHFPVECLTQTITLI